MPSGDEIGTVRPLNRSRWGPTRVLLGPLGAHAPRGPKNRYSEFWGKYFGHFLGIELADSRVRHLDICWNTEVLTGVGMQHKRGERR